MLYTPLMLSLLGQSEYGLYQLVYSVVSYLSLLNLGFGSAYVRYYSIYKAKNDEVSVSRLNGIYMIVFSVIGVVAALCGVALTMNTENIFSNSLTPDEISTATVLMALLVFNIAVSFPFSLFTSYITANERYFFQKIVTIIKSILNPFLVLPILLLGFKSIGLVVVTVLLNLAVEITYAFFCLKKLDMKFSFKNLDFKVLKQIAIFSSFIFINIVVDQVNWNIDKFLLGILQGTTAVAVYSIAIQIKTYYFSFSSSVSSVFIPSVHKMVAEKKEDSVLTNIFTKVGRIQYILLSLILIGVVFFGQSFVYLWAGEEYSESYTMLLLLIIPATIPLIQSLGIEIQRAKNLHKFRSITYLIIAVINVIVSIPLCKVYGGIGCAIGTCFALIIGQGFIMNFYYHKRCGLDMVYFWKEILKISKAFIIPIVFCVIVHNNAELYSWKAIFLYGSIYSLIYVVNMWCFGLNNYEKNVFLKLFKKFT